MNSNIGVARGEFGPLDGVILHEPDGFLPYGTSFIQKLAIIVDVEPTPARTFDEVRATATMLDRTKARFGIKPKRLAADTAYGTGKFLGWLVDQEIEPHIPVWDKGSRDDGTFSRSDFIFDPEQDQCICPAGKVLKQFRRNYAVARTDSAHDGIRTEHPKRTARPANSSRDAVQTCYLAISSAASAKRPAITPVNLPERRSSSDPGTNGRSRDAVCASQDHYALRANAPPRADGRQGRVPLRGHRPEPQAHGSAGSGSLSAQCGPRPAGSISKSLRSRHQQCGAVDGALHSFAASTQQS